jgi:hypothetical protein
MHFISEPENMLLPQALQLREHIRMADAVWFLILAALSVLLLIYTFWRKRDLKLVALYSFLNTISVIFELVIFVFLQSYAYYPHILKKTYYDMNLGSYLSQVLYVSSVALFIAAFNLGYGWILFFIAMFVGIEFLFLSLGIYKLNWWNSGYTAAGLLIYFWISKKWYTLLLQASSRFIRLITLYCLGYSIYSNLLNVPFMLDYFYFGGGWFADPARDSVAVKIVYFLILSVVPAMVCFYRLHWTILAAAPVVMLITHLVSIQLHILNLKHLWVLFMFSASDMLVLLCCYYFNRVLSKVQK